MYIKVSIPEHFQLKIMPSLYSLMFRRENDVHYIGGAEVLPAPLDAKREAECIENEILMYLRRSSKTKLEVSIDEPLNVDWDGNELLLSDILGTDEDLISKDIENEVERKLLGKAIEKLSGRERMIIEMRFGLNTAGGEEMTQKEVADRMGISQSYISRLEKKIMKRLKKEIVRFE